MNDTDMFEVFGDVDPMQYAAAVKDRWGDTDACTESARRTARHTKEDWKGHPRFAATYERVQPGLAVFLRDAIRVRAGLPA